MSLPLLHFDGLNTLLLGGPGIFNAVDVFYCLLLQLPKTIPV